MSDSLVVDGSNFVRVQCGGRQGHVHPDTIASAMTRNLLEFCHARAIDRAFVVFDSGKRSWRHEAYEDWKANRKNKIEGVAESIERAKDNLSRTAIQVFQPGDPFDGDDAVATIVESEATLGNRVVVYSNDKDFRQLLDAGRIVILQRIERNHGLINYTWFSADDLAFELKIEPWQWPHVAALIGDTSDNWKGAEGIGIETGAALIQAHKTLDQVVEMGSLLRLTKRQHKGLARLDWRLGLRLMTLRLDSPIVAI